MKRPSDTLTSLEINALIEAMFYFTEADVRRKVMAACPVAYSKLFPETTDKAFELAKKAMREDV